MAGKWQREKGNLVPNGQQQSWVRPYPNPGNLLIRLHGLRMV